MPLTTTVSVSRKLNDRDYGHGEVFISVSGVDVDTTKEEIDEILEQSRIVYTKEVEHLRKRIADLKEKMF